MGMSDETVQNYLQQKVAILHCNWSYIIQYREKYLGSEPGTSAAASTSSSRQQFFVDKGETLDSWLNKAEVVAEMPETAEAEMAEKVQRLESLMDEVAETEALYKEVLGQLQSNVSSMMPEEIEEIMTSMREKRSRLVFWRDRIPQDHQRVQVALKAASEIQSSKENQVKMAEKLKVISEEMQKQQNDVDEILALLKELVKVQTEIGVAKAKLVSTADFTSFNAGSRMALVGNYDSILKDSAVLVSEALKLISHKTDHFELTSSVIEELHSRQLEIITKTETTEESLGKNKAFMAKASDIKNKCENAKVKEALECAIQTLDALSSIDVASQPDLDEVSQVGTSFSRILPCNESNALIMLISLF